MNPHPGDSINLGVTRCPAPARALRLDAALFTDPDTVRLMVAHWTRHQLHALAGTLMDAGDRRASGLAPHHAMQRPTTWGIT